MDDLRKSLASIAASLHVLGANTKENTEDLQGLSKTVTEMATLMTARMDLMAARNRQTEEAVRNLQGTFASIEMHLVKLFETDEELKREVQGIKQRVEALEKRQPPAA